MTCSTAAERLSNDFRISVGTQQINTDTDEGKVSIDWLSQYRDERLQGVRVKIEWYLKTGIIREYDLEQ